ESADDFRRSDPRADVQSQSSSGTGYSRRCAILVPSVSWESTMTCPSLFRYLSASALTVLTALPAGAQSIAGKGKTGPVPNPVNLDTTGLFQAKFVSVGDDMFIGSQPR